jgi:hypothetical protein
MTRAKQNPTLDSLIEAAVAAPTAVDRRNIAARARKVAIQKPKRGRGQPTKFNPAVAAQILSRISNGETLPKIVESLSIPIQNIYNWMDKNPAFLESYQRSREQQAKTLVDRMLDETADLKNDQALAARVRSDVIKWVAARYAPSQFSDSKRIELKGEVRHLHTHELAPEQKRRIAESWLISQQEKDFPGIEVTTTGPDREPGVIVQEEEPKELPRRKKPVVKKPALEVDESGKWRGH